MTGTIPVLPDGGIEGIMQCSTLSPQPASDSNPRTLERLVGDLTWFLKDVVAHSGASRYDKTVAESKPDGGG